MEKIGIFSKFKSFFKSKKNNDQILNQQKTEEEKKASLRSSTIEFSQLDEDTEKSTKQIKRSQPIKQRNIILIEDQESLNRLKNGFFGQSEEFKEISIFHYEPLFPDIEEEEEEEISIFHYEPLFPDDTIEKKQNKKQFKKQIEKVESYKINKGEEPSHNVLIDDVEIDAMILTM